MSELPKVSVVITMYNEERYIKKCLETLLNQTYPNIEVILVDNACTDRTVEIAKKFPFKIIRKDINQGPGPARNLGAENAIGEILVFVDADMKFDMDYIKYLVQPIIEGKCIGTSHMQEYIANKDNIWARSWGMKRANPEMTWKKVGLFRAVLKEEFLKTGGFNPRRGYFDDGSIYEKNNKMGLAVRDAICYHNNPASLMDVFNHSKWIGGSLIVDYKNLLNLKFFLHKPKRARKVKLILSFVVSIILFVIILSWTLKINLKQEFFILLISGLVIILPLPLAINRAINEKYPKYILFLPFFYLVKFSGLIFGALEQIPNIINKKIRREDVTYKY